MARKARPNFVYVMLREDGQFKIGCSGVPTERLRVLQAGCGPSLRLVHTLERLDGDAYQVERIAHALVGFYRRHGEWFAAPQDLVIYAVEAATWIQNARVVQAAMRARIAAMELGCRRQFSRKELLRLGMC